jgi:hypothetical protein
VVSPPNKSVSIWLYRANEPAKFTFGLLLLL